MGSFVKISLILFFGCSLFRQGTLGHEFETCESLSKDNCAFAVDSQGKRCLLEKGDEDNTFRCVETEVQAKDLAGYIETDSCIEVCATDREVLGWPKAIPIDRVCATECRDACKNVFDFYSHVATSGGKALESLCEHAKIKTEQTDESHSNSDSDSETDHHRRMSEVDSGAPASAPSTGGARPVSEIAASLWGAATSFLDSPAAKSPTASENAVNAAASSPVAAGYEDDYSGSP